MPRVAACVPRVAACDAEGCSLRCGGRRACLSEEARSPFGPVYFLYARPLAVVCIAHLGMHAAVG